MTNITYFGLSDFSFNAYGGELTYSSFVSSSDSEYVFMNTDGVRVTMTGEGIEIDSNNRFVRGTITEIEISPRGGSETDVDVRISDLSIDGIEILGSGGSDVPSSDKAWEAVMSGDVSLTAVGTGRMDLAMDAPRLRASDIMYGSDSSVTGDFGITSYLMGSVAYVYDTAIVTGGSFTFSGQSRYVLGDVWNLYDSAVVVGGNDSLTFDPGTENPDLHASAAIYFGGDARGVREQSTLIGGDDMIDMRAAKTDQTVYATGDAFYTQVTAQLIGGDDLIYGARKSENQLFGDLQTHVATASFVGGDDTIYGGNKNDLIYGDIGDTETTYHGGDDTLFGGAGADTIYGGSGDDMIYDAFGSGAIFGGNGDDRFKQTKNGAHNFDGGAGIDIVDYSVSTTALVVDLEDRTQNDGWAQNDTLSNVEGVRGTVADDAFFGTKRDESLWGVAGDDTLDGRNGDDALFGGRGDDTFIGSDGKDDFFGGKGDDAIDYGDSTAGVRVNLSTGSFKRGQAKHDDATDVEDIFGTAFDDRLIGDDEDNCLRGRDGDDELKGGDGDDELFGGKGDDDLISGAGDDMMKGGTGEDTFFFTVGDDNDRIRDFEDDVDSLALSGVDLTALGSAQQIGNDLLIDFGSGDTLYIDNMTIAQLNNDLIV